MTTQHDREPYPHPDLRETYCLPLTRGAVALIDAQDVPRVSGRLWSLSKRRQIQSSPHLVLHRFITEAPDGMPVDHINHDTLDNRRANLRVCTQEQNMANTKVDRKNNTSGFKGVYRRPNGKFYAIIGGSTKRKHLGCFSSAVEAARSYNDAAVEMFGSFACLNEIPHEPKE